MDKYDEQKSVYRNFSFPKLGNKNFSDFDGAVCLLHNLGIRLASANRSTRLSTIYRDLLFTKSHGTDFGSGMTSEAAEIITVINLIL